MKKEWLLISGAILSITMIFLFSASVYKEANPSGTFDPNVPQTGERTKESEGTKGTTGNVIANTPSGGAGGGGAAGYRIEPPNQEERVYCTPESRLIEECLPEDHPVCGWFDEEQISCDEGDPCVRSTFPNECEACITPTILYWTNDECPIHR